MAVAERSADRFRREAAASEAERRRIHEEEAREAHRMSDAQRHAATSATAVGAAVGSPLQHERPRASDMERSRTDEEAALPRDYVPAHAYTVCTFWYIEALVDCGRGEEARMLLDVSARRTRVRAALRRERLTALCACYLVAMPPCCHAVMLPWCHAAMLPCCRSPLLPRVVLGRP